MKRAIEARQGHARGLDDIGEAVIKGVKRKASKAVNDIFDPKFPAKKVYNKKGGMTKKYKDYVLREMGDY